MEDVAKFGVGKTVETLGDYLREQRLAASLSLRQLAEQTGVSNPYLSQIERGLRKPSAEVLQQLAKGAAHLGGDALRPRRDPQPRRQRGPVRRAGHPRRQRADRATEAVAAGRVPVVPGSELPPEQHQHRRKLTWRRPSAPPRPTRSVRSTPPWVASTSPSRSRAPASPTYRPASPRSSVSPRLSSARCRPRPRPSRRASRRRSTSSSPSSTAPSTTSTSSTSTSPLRGKNLVGRIRRQQATQDLKAETKKTATKAKTTTTQAKKATSTREVVRQGHRHRGQEDRDRREEGHHRRRREDRHDRHDRHDWHGGARAASVDGRSSTVERRTS